MSMTAVFCLMHLDRKRTIYAPSIRNEPYMFNLIHEILQRLLCYIKELGLDQP
jgi:hypothetical protein